MENPTEKTVLKEPGHNCSCVVCTGCPACVERDRREAEESGEARLG